MRGSICDSFRALAIRTHDHLTTAARVNHQPLEETLTDLNILDLKVRHPIEIHSRVFNKRQEGTNGADWEWWLTNAKKSIWLGLRIQAKILHLASNSFPHLHYKSGQPPTFQVARLKHEALSDGLVPLYCFYIRVDTPAPNDGCRSFPPAREYYGCSLSSINHVETLQLHGQVDDLAAVLSQATPWHCLVCCRGYGGDDLPSRAWSFLKSAFSIAVLGEQNQKAGQFGPRARPPHYVLATLGDSEMADIRERPSRGLVVIAPQADE